MNFTLLNTPEGQAGSTGTVCLPQCIINQLSKNTMPVAAGILPYHAVVAIEK
jgi:hypothetical protein